MPYKVKNITDDPRQFRERKTIAGHFLRAGEEIIVENEPAVSRPDVFEVTKIHNSEMKEESRPENRDRGERRFNKKK